VTMLHGMTRGGLRVRRLRRRERRSVLKPNLIGCLAENFLSLPNRGPSRRPTDVKGQES